MKKIAFHFTAEDCDDDVSVIDVEDLDETSSPRLVRYPVFLSGRFYGIASCAVTADATSAVLDYGACPEANLSPAMVLVAARLRLARRNNDLKIVGVEWRAPGAAAFVRVPFKILDWTQAPDFPSFEESQREAAAAVAGLSDDELAKALCHKPAPAKRLEVTTTPFFRNPLVVEATLRRAKGACERCGADAPFISRATGRPYLEVHHIHRLADGGVDHPSNTLALCPNCHRAMHCA